MGCRGLGAQPLPPGWKEQSWDSEVEASSTQRGRKGCSGLTSVRWWAVTEKLAREWQKRGTSCCRSLHYK